MPANNPAQKTILLVDDDREFVESNKDLLEEEGYRVLTAYDGAAGLQKAIEERPDLLVLDVMMATDTEGFEISRKIPETPQLRKMPVLLVTGIRRALHLPFGFEPDNSWLPVSEVMEKPIDPEKFLQKIQKLLG